MSEDMSQLKQLVFGDDSPADASSKHHFAQPKILDQGHCLTKTRLGKTIDEMMVSWAQLLENVNIKPPIPPSSTLENVKEVAELCVKQYRDAALDVNTELTRLSMMWERDQEPQFQQEKIRDLEVSIKRQNAVLAKAKTTLQRRTDEFFNNPTN